MDKLLTLAMEMILCLLIAALIGAIIGYLLGKIGKCDDKEELNAQLRGQTQKLHDYESESVDEESQESKNYVAANATSAAASGLSASLQETENENKNSELMQAFQKTNIEGIEGERPQVLSAPRDGFPDDLKEISGIGLKIEEALNELGIFHFDQIAAWTSENAKWIDNYLVFKGRVLREDWIGQAKLLAAGGSTEFSRKVKRGDTDYQ